MMQFLKSRLGMFTVFAVVLAGALMVTLLVRSQRVQPTQSEQGAANPQTQAQAKMQPAAQPAAKPNNPAAQQNSAAGRAPSNDSVQNFKQNVPVPVYHVPGRTEQSGNGNSNAMPSSAVQSVERSAARIDNPPSASGMANSRDDRKDQKPAPATMISFSRHRSSTAGTGPIQSVQTNQKDEVTISKRFLPFGRAIKAELVNALVSSSHNEAPIIAMVTEDVKDWSTNEVIIPAGSELHGTTRPDKALKRIFSGDQWTLILPKSDARMPGAEIRLRGIALNRDETMLPNGASTFSPYDMGPGIEAEMVKTDDEIKLFLGEALKGFAQVSQSKDTQNTVMGTTQTIQNTSRNALLGAGSAVADRYAEIALEEFKTNGWFLQVRPSKQIYVYVQQTVDMETARIGYTTVNPEQPGAQTAGTGTARAGVKDKTAPGAQ